MDALRLLPPRVRGKAKDFFTYNITFNTIAAGGTSTAATNIQGDSDFWWIIGAATITNAAGTTFTAPSAAPFLVEVTDASAGRQLQDSATHLSNLFGTAQLPFQLPYPREFKASGQLQVKLQNQDAGNAYVVRLAFHGFKFYPTIAEPQA